MASKSEGEIMYRSIVAGGMLLALLAWSPPGACASGAPEANDGMAPASAPGPGQGRIYFYRDRSIFGTVMRPDIRLNGEIVGTSRPGEYFFVDRPEGKYIVSTQTETTNSIEFGLEAGQIRFVRTYVTMGLLVGRVQPQLIDPNQGATEISGLTLVGAPSLASGKPAADSPVPAIPAPATKPVNTVTMDDLRGLLPNEAPAGRPDGGLDDLKDLLQAESR